ncbi:MAG: hypothetical protein CL933_03225 [Deltaproteobacteria bacterium]|nr:hypothetical protein [Deltaproteobacteria bacterium]
MHRAESPTDRRQTGSVLQRIQRIQAVKGLFQGIQPGQDRGPEAFTATRNARPTPERPASASIHRLRR